MNRNMYMEYLMMDYNQWEDYKLLSLEYILHTHWDRVDMFSLLNRYHYSNILWDIII